MSRKNQHIESKKVLGPFVAIQHFSIENTVYRKGDPVSGFNADKEKELLEKGLIKEVQK